MNCTRRGCDGDVKATRSIEHGTVYQCEKCRGWVRGETSHVNIHLDGKTIVALLIEQLDKHAAATGGIGSKRSDVLDHMNPETATDGRDSTEYLRRLHAGELD